jgi:MFS family permease
MVLVGLINTVAAFGFSRMAYPLLLRDMQLELDLSYLQAGLLATTNTIGYTLIGLAVGVVAPALGARRALTLAMALCCAGALAMGMTARFEGALLTMLMLGAGAGLGIAVGGALPRAWTPPAERGLTTGIVTSGGGIGMLLTGALLPFLLGAYGQGGWRWTWATLGVFSLTVAAFNLLVVRDETRIAGAAPSLAAWKEVLSSAVLWHLALVFALFHVTFGAYSTFVAAYFQQVLGWSAAGTGSLWVAIGIFGATGAVLAGLLADRVGRRLALLVSLGMLGAASLATSLSAIPLVPVLSVVVFGLAQAGVPCVMMTACGDYLGPRLAAGAIGVALFVGGVGSMLGPAAAGWLLDNHAPFASVFLLAAASAAAGFMLTLRLAEPSSSKDYRPSPIRGEQRVDY